MPDNEFRQTFYPWKIAGSRGFESHRARLKMIKLVIFDLGNVCFNIDWIKINEEMVKQFKINTLVKSSGDEKVIGYYNKTLEGKKTTKDFFKELNKEGYNIDEIVSFYKNLYKEYKKPNKKIMQLIKNLKKKVKVACLTDTNDIHFEAHKEQKSLESFDYVFASFQLGSKKSDKNTFVKILNQVKLLPEEAIFIDDDDRNIENAQSLGIKAVKYKDYNQLVKDLSHYNLF